MDPISTIQYSRPAEQWLRDMYGARYNKDELHYKDYQIIKQDPQVSLARRLIFNYLLSKDYYITPASQDPQDIEVNEWVEHCLGDMDMSMKQVRQHIYSALDYGYSVSEIIYKIDNEGYIALIKLVGVQAETLYNCFILDELGNITSVVQKLMGYNEPVFLPAEKCLVYTFEGEVGNPYGTSLLKGLNDTVFLKKKVTEWLAIFLQKHGSPALAGKISAAADVERFLESLENIRDGGTVLTHGNEDEVYIIESSKSGEAFF